LPEPGTNEARKRGRKGAFTQKDLTRLKIIGRFREVLAEVLERPGMRVARSFADARRLLSLGDYLSLWLLAAFHPVTRTLRGLIRASWMPRVQSEVCSRAVSAGSFSEAQALVEPALLEALFGHLCGQLPQHAPRVGSPLRAASRQRWLVRDSSLFPALPRMSWAFFGAGRAGVSSAVRLHITFELLRDAPTQASITPGKSCERAVLREDLEPGAAYIGDRYFGEHHAFLTYLSRRGCRYLIRLWDCGVRPAIEQELPLSTQDAVHGVLRQAWVRLGSSKNGTLSERLRLIQVRGCAGQDIRLVTNLPPEELSAADAALLYKERWQVEYFFRWLKCLLGDGQWHWLAESPKGVAIQLYTTLIASVLLQLDIGRRPSKRIWEMMRWHMAGMMDEQTLKRLIARQLACEAAERQRRIAKKSIFSA